MQHSGIRMRNYQYFFISIKEKQSLKGVIQNSEYEIGIFQPFSTLQYSCSAPLLKILKNTFEGVYCFVKLHPLNRQSCFNVDTKSM